MRGRRLSIHALGITVMIAGNVLMQFHESWWPFTVWGAGAGIIINNALRAKGDAHGRNRGTPTHPRNPGTIASGGTFTIAGSFAAATGTSTSLTAYIDEFGSPLPVSDNKDPILAARFIDLAWDLRQNKVLFSGVAMKSHLFGLDATARCDGSLHPGEAPNVGCRCGFYAVPSDQLDSHVGYGASLSAEVELFGRVIEHERGYRAQRQRILSLTRTGVLRPPRCRMCGHPVARDMAASYWGQSDRDRLLAAAMNQPRLSLLGWVHETCATSSGGRIYGMPGHVSPSPPVLSLREVEKQLGIPIKMSP